MKSKTSFFNKTIFWKNVTLYWPLWGLYTLLLLGIQPFFIWTEFYTAMHYYGNANTLTAKMEQVIHILEFEPMVFIIAFSAVIIGMAVFNYMYNSKSANMIHALPVNKTELFGTNVISGLAFLIVPQILTFLVSVFVCLAYGMTRVEYLAIWLLIAMATAFIAFAFVTVCAMFTGQLFALPVYVIVVNFFSYWVYTLIGSVVSMFGYGVDAFGSNIEDIVQILSPLMCFSISVGVEGTYNDRGICTGMEVEGTGFLIVYFIVALVLYAIAYVTYQKRHIESAGELITVKWLRPIFRWGVGITGGILGSILACQLFRELGMNASLLVFILMMLFLGVIAYFAADMFVRKSFRVFKKKNWMGCGAFSVALLATFFGLYALAEMQENYVPKQSEIASASISMGYDITLEQEQVQTIIDLHEDILSNKSYLEKFEEEQYYSWNWEQDYSWNWEQDYEYVSIYYWLQNGNYISRSYMLPYEQENTESLIEKIMAMEKQPEIYLAHELGKNYDKVTEFGTGWFEAQFADVQISEDTKYYEEYEYEDFRYQNKALTPEMVEKLWAAVIADAKAGTLLKYNVYSSWAQRERENLQNNLEEMLKNSQEAADIDFSESLAYSYDVIASLELEYRDPDGAYRTMINMDPNSYGSATQAISIEDNENWSTIYLSFGFDCENIINALIECELIASAEDIYWGETVYTEENSVTKITIGTMDAEGQSYYKEFTSEGDLELLNNMLLNVAGELLEKELAAVDSPTFWITITYADGEVVKMQPYTDFEDSIVQIGDDYYNVSDFGWQEKILDFYKESAVEEVTVLVP